MEKEKEFTKGQIMDRLQRMLPDNLYTMLHLDYRVPGGIGICAGITVILSHLNEEHVDDQHREKVSLLLADLCRQHFAKVNSRVKLGRRSSKEDHEKGT